MASKLDPTMPSEWQEYYRVAERRRRDRGWKRRGETRKPKRKIGASEVLAIVMGLATVVVALCLVLPT
jgi:hypothetical protein